MKKIDKNNVFDSSLAPDPAVLQRLEKVVMEIFSSEDFHKADIRAIASKAGVSGATIYKYYESKEKLLFAFIDKWMKELAARQLDHLHGLEDIKEKLRKIIWVNLDYYERNPGVGQILFMTVPTKAWMADKSFPQRDFIDTFLMVLAEGQQKGRLNPTVPVSVLLDFIHGIIIRTFQMWVYRGRKVNLTDQAKAMFEMVWRGISNPDSEEA